MNDPAVLESDALRAFRVFAEHESFTAAAAALHISQPALHAKVGKLARRIDVPLYERVGQRVRLTPAGAQLAVFAADHHRRVEDFLAGLTGGSAGLEIVAGRGALRWVIGDALRVLARSAREVRVRTAHRDGVLDALGSGRADVGVIAWDPPPARLEAREVARYPQVLIVSARHPLAGHAQVGLEDLDGLGMVLPPPDRPHRRSLQRACGERGVTLHVHAEADGWDLLVHLAAVGLGATIVNGCVHPPRGLVALPLRDLPSVAYWAAWRPERTVVVANLVAALDRK